MSSSLTMPKAGRCVGVSLRCAVACVLFLLAAPTATIAQQPPKSESNTPVGDFFGAIGRWIDDSFANIGSGFKDAKGGVDNFNREAGIVAKSTADAAKDAAGAVARIPGTRVISGHQNCAIAANGAPDCIAAAETMCKAKGFAGGNSIDMTTAEECPAQVMLGRRAAKPGECRNVTFITRALCQ